MPMLRAEMIRSYRVSRSNAAYTVVFSLIWWFNDNVDAYAWMTWQER